jgi:hypothetical protein
MYTRETIFLMSNARWHESHKHDKCTTEHFPWSIYFLVICLGLFDVIDLFIFYLFLFFGSERGLTSRFFLYNEAKDQTYDL